MLDFSQIQNSYIACGYTDMRKQIDGLVAVVELQFGRKPDETSIFLFCGRRADRIKALYVAMKDIAARQQISKKYLETFTTQLASADILGIRRGKSGGYRLLRDPSHIVLLDVIEAVEGSLHAVACLECEPNRCSRAGFCMSLPAWKGLEDVVTGYLNTVTLQQLIDQAVPQPENIEDYPCWVRTG